jgi:hypothetical protein
VQNRRNRPKSVNRPSGRMDEQERLAQLVLTLSHELELAREDNVQLRAAVRIYQELLSATKPDFPEAGAMRRN